MKTTDALAAELIAHQTPPCLSLYQPTHTDYPDKQKDQVVFRKLVRDLAAALAERDDERATQELLRPLQALAQDAAFWTQASKGLAAFSARGLFEVHRLPRPVPELAVVADSFHVKPLLRIAQSADRYHVLGVTRDRVMFFAGNRDSIAAVDLDPSVPATLAAALGSELTEPYHTVVSRGQGPVLHHGQGAKKDEVDNDLARFFRAVDRAVLDKYSRPSRQALILLALPEYHALFHQVSNNPFLLPEGIAADPGGLSLPELRTRAWRAVEPRYLARLTALVEAHGAAQAQQRGAADVADIAAAAAASRVATLLVDAERHIPGRVDPATGRIALAPKDAVDADDLLDDVAELVLRRGGEVVMVPAARMPTTTGLAAIYRY